MKEEWQEVTKYLKRQNQLRKFNIQQKKRISEEINITVKWKCWI
jgi:hypothetical protein